METRINPLGNKEIKIQPNGLPAIWVELYCDRCKPYQECLGLKALNDSEWQKVNNIISSTNSTHTLKKELNKILHQSSKVLACNTSSLGKVEKPTNCGANCGANKKAPAY